jgi:hemerythrin-like metal-binding protein
MEWTPDLSVGVEEIDGQHRELFLRINRLVEAVKRSECKYVIGDVMKFLHEYVVEHFGDEEAIMLRHEYPHYEEHRAQHAGFIEGLADMEEELKNEESSYTRSVYTNQMVVDWIINHISKLDKELGRYLKPEAQGQPGQD